MRTVVRFRTDDGEFAVDVADARAVLPAADLSPLPGRDDDVAGLVHLAEGALTVLDPFSGSGGEHLLLLEAGGRRFGLVAGRVLGVVRYADAEVHPPPAGQGAGMVAGTLPPSDPTSSRRALLVDAAALARRLAG